MRKILLIISVMALTLALVVPAMAGLNLKIGEEQTLYMDGYVVYGTWWHDTAKATDKDDGDLEWSNWGSSRATVSITSGDISGTYQVGFSPSFDLVYTRLIHATYTINDDMSLQIGKMFAPWYFWGNSRAAYDSALTGYGAPWDWFDPAIVFRFYGAFIEFMEPVTGDLDGDDDIDTYENFDTSLPRIYVGYNYSTDGLFVGGALGYNTYKIDESTLNESVNAWVALAHASVKITDMLSIRTAGHYGTNPDQLHFVGYADSGHAIVSNGSIEDTKALAGFAELSAEFGDLTARVGYGYRVLDNDTWTEKDDSQTYYAQLVVPIYTHESGASFTVYPEVAVFDEMEDNTGAKEDKSTYVGAVWQIAF